MARNLANETCKPCRKDTPPLDAGRLWELSAGVRQWEVVDGHHLRREFRFGDFREALRFVNRVGEVAEAEGHHPDVAFGWGYVELRVFTHVMDGLSENDFILAAKIDTLGNDD